MDERNRTDPQPPAGELPVAARQAAGGAPPGDFELEALRARLAEQDALLAEREQRERELIARYREALAAADPLLTPGDLTGETVEELEQSYQRARALAARVERARLSESVPAGSPPRSRPAPATAFEKIREGLTARERGG